MKKYYLVEKQERNHDGEILTIVYMTRVKPKHFSCIVWA